MIFTKNIGVVSGLNNSLPMRGSGTVTIMCHDIIYYMPNGILPATKTVIFSIFLLVKIRNSYVPNVPDVRARPKKISRQSLVACFCTNMAAPRIFVEVSDDDLGYF